FVQGLDDEFFDGNQQISVVFGPASSVADPNYNNLAVPSQGVTILDEGLIFENAVSCDQYWYRHVIQRRELTPPDGNVYTKYVSPNRLAHYWVTAAGVRQEAYCMMVGDGGWTRVLHAQSGDNFTNLTGWVSGVNVDAANMVAGNGLASKFPDAMIRAIQDAPSTYTPDPEIFMDCQVGQVHIKKLWFSTNANHSTCYDHNVGLGWTTAALHGTLACSRGVWPGFDNYNWTVAGVPVSSRFPHLFYQLTPDIHVGSSAGFKCSVYAR
ncbi:MAG: hypothetical protein RRB13_16240, partial [bacterium]|nr:hypothetical protein [bacterium]